MMKTNSMFFSALFICSNLILYPSFYEHSSYDFYTHDHENTLHQINTQIDDLTKKIHKKFEEKNDLERRLGSKHGNLKAKAELEDRIHQLSDEINNLYQTELKLRESAHEMMYHHSYYDYYSDHDNYYHHDYDEHNNFYDSSYPDYYSDHDTYYHHGYSDYYSDHDNYYHHDYPDLDHEHDSYYHHGYHDFYSPDSNFYTTKHPKSKKDLHNQLAQFSPYKKMNKEHANFKKDLQKLIDGLKNKFISVTKWDDIVAQAKNLKLTDRFIQDLKNLSKKEQKEFKRIINKILAL